MEEIITNQNVFRSHKNCKKYLINIKKLQRDGKIKSFNETAESSKQVLEEFTSMRIWVKTLLSIYGSLPNILKLIDSIIAKNAANPFGTNFGESAIDQVDRVISLTDRKNKLLNIYLLIKKMIENACEDEKQIINFKFVNKITIPAMAQKLNCTERNVFRKINNMIDRLAASSIERGWTICFIESQLTSEPWIMENFNIFKKEEEKRVR